MSENKNRPVPRVFSRTNSITKTSLVVPIGGSKTKITSDIPDIEDVWLIWMLWRKIKKKKCSDAKPCDGCKSVLTTLRTFDCLEFSSDTTTQ